MTDTQRTDTAVVPSAPRALSENVERQWSDLISQVPDAQDGDGLERLLSQIAAAQTVADLDAPWRSSDLEDFEGKAIGVLSIKKAPSTYAGGLAWFLVVDAVDMQTGEQITFTTGSVMVVAQLVRAWSLGSLPYVFGVVLSERETANGGRPQHLRPIRPLTQPAGATAG